MQEFQIKTLSVRVRDKHAKLLSRMAVEINQVWNYCNDLSYRSIRERSLWMSGYDLQKYTAGYSNCDKVNIGSTTIQSVCEEYAKCRKQFKKNKLKWRTSFGSKRLLGWIPFKKGAAKWHNGQLKFGGKYFKVWDSYNLSQYEFRSGSFSQDARGRWYFNVVVQIPIDANASKKAIGIDLGLKTIATTSDGEKLENAKIYQGLEEKLGKAQRASNKKQVRNIYAKIKNCRKDAIHKFTTKIAKENCFIVVGNVSSSKLAKTKMAKSVLDAGWYMLKTQLKYKAIRHSGEFIEINEKYSTQVCSCCNKIGDNSPKGMNGLGIRNWECSHCGAQLDRDINAAKNILNFGFGYKTPVEEFAVI